MGKKKYYCEYCERTFNDDIPTRTKHFKSANHLKNKSDHYFLFREPAEILAQESAKKPCRRFMNDGSCQFGNSCIYTHFSPVQLGMLEQQLAQIEMEKMNPPQLPMLESWLVKNLPEASVLSDNSRTIRSVLSHEVPLELSHLQLPPSMRPALLSEVLEFPLATWGE